jgi:glycosyltransferase involved in cell wall biosynthesis
MTKNICFFNSCQIWGGGEKWHHDVAIKMSQAGYSVMVCTNHDSELGNQLSKTSIPVYPFAVRNLSFLNPFIIFLIYRLLKRNNIDSIILGLPSDVKAAGLAAKLAGVKKIIYRRGTALSVKNSFVNRWLYKFVITDVITNSMEIKRKFLSKNINLFKEDHIHVIYNGIDTSIHTFATFKPSTQTTNFVKNETPIILGNAGRLVKQKGQKYLIELAKVLQVKNVNFKIQIAGKGLLKKSLVAYAKQLKVEDKIEFLDFVDDMEGFFQKIDIFLFPSIHEGSANTILEAMWYAKPVVTFDISSMPELVENNVTGYLIPPGNMEAFADKVIALMQNPNMRKKMGENAQNQIVEKFNQTEILPQLLKILNS